MATKAALVKLAACVVFSGCCCPSSLGPRLRPSEQGDSVPPTALPLTEAIQPASTSTWQVALRDDFTVPGTWSTRDDEYLRY